MSTGGGPDPKGSDSSKKRSSTATIESRLITGYYYNVEKTKTTNGDKPEDAVIKGIHKIIVDNCRRNNCSACSTSKGPKRGNPHVELRSQTPLKYITKFMVNFEQIDKDKLGREEMEGAEKEIKQYWESLEKNEQSQKKLPDHSPEPESGGDRGKKDADPDENNENKNATEKELMNPTVTTTTGSPKPETEPQTQINKDGKTFKEALKEVVKKKQPSRPRKGKSENKPRPAPKAYKTPSRGYKLSASEGMWFEDDPQNKKVLTREELERLINLNKDSLAVETATAVMCLNKHGSSRLYGRLVVAIGASRGEKTENVNKTLLEEYFKIHNLAEPIKKTITQFLLNKDGDYSGQVMQIMRHILRNEVMAKKELSLEGQMKKNLEETEKKKNNFLTHLSQEVGKLGEEGTAIVPHLEPIVKALFKKNHKNAYCVVADKVLVGPIKNKIRKMISEDFKGKKYNFLEKGKWNTKAQEWIESSKAWHQKKENGKNDQNGQKGGQNGQNSQSRPPSQKKAKNNNDSKNENSNASDENSANGRTGGENG